MFCRGSVVIMADLACAGITALGLFGAAMAALAVGMLVSQDAGGPMFLPIAAMGAALAAAALSGALFSVTLVVEGLRRLFKARWWATSLVAVPVVSAVCGLAACIYAPRPLVSIGVAAGALVLFGAYWHAYLAAEIILTRLADRFFPNRICAPSPRS